MTRNKTVSIPEAESRTMASYGERFRFLCIPFFISTSVLLTVYTFFNWLLNIKYRTGNPEGNLASVILPISFALLITFIFYGRRINVLTFERYRGSRLPFLICILAHSVPLIIAQSLVVDFSGGMTELKNLTEFDSQNTTRFYRLTDFYLPNVKSGEYDSWSMVHSRHSSDYVNYYSSFVKRVSNSIHDSLENQEKGFWFVKTYSILNAGRDYDPSVFKSFVATSERAFRNETFRDFNYLKLLHTDEAAGFQNELIDAGRNSKEAYLFIPVNEDYSDRYGDLPYWFIGSFAGLIIFWLIVTNNPILEKRKLDAFMENNLTYSGNFKSNS